MAASHRVVLHRAGKTPVTRRIAVECDSDDEAVICAMRWTVWSHAQGRPRRLPRYTDWTVQRRADDGWETIREGTFSDAQAQCQTENEAETIPGAISQNLFYGYEARHKAGKRTHSRRAGGTSRLAQLVSRVLGEQ